MQELAGNVEYGLDVEVAFTLPQLEKVDVLGVPQQPGGLVIERIGTFLQLAHAQGDTEALALGAEAPARRSARRREGRIGAPFEQCGHVNPKLMDRLDRLFLSRAITVYLRSCERVHKECNYPVFGGESGNACDFHGGGAGHRPGGLWRREEG
jgi:hypothetical protein